MSCEEMQNKLEAYLDGELTLSDQRTVQEHLSQCERCEVKFQHLKMLSKLAKKVEYSSAPAALRRAVKRGLRERTGEDQFRFGGWHLFGAGMGSAALASLCVWGVISFTTASQQQSASATQLVDAHVRSMMLAHLTDVVSSDRHTVKPWFNGKLDFAPVVPDLQDQGFELIGGRLDYVQQQPAAVLVYKRRAHLINVFISRTSAAAVVPAARQRGYTLIGWRGDGLDYTLVSDLNEMELRQFAKLLQGKKPAV